MKILINYADDNFRDKQAYCTKMAKKKGKFDKVIEYSPSIIDDDFYKKNYKILSQKRGAGYWLWKPYILKKTLETLNYNDYLFYCDSGACFIDNVDILVSSLESSESDMMVYELPLIEKQWTKRDAFILMDCDKEEFSESNQRLATYFMLKKTSKTEEFVDDYLKFCLDERILTDIPNTTKDNYLNFIDHRHDQSVFSLLTKKYNIQAFKDPSERGELPKLYLDKNRLYYERLYTNSSYNRVLFCYKKQNKLKYSIKVMVLSKMQKLKMLV